jgi:uncharacterized protein with GYD domain
MGYYMYQGCLTAESVKSSIDKPNDRLVPLTLRAQTFGGKIHSYFMSFGEFDFVVIAEFPDDAAAGACSLAMSAMGALSRLQTTKLLTPDEAKDIMAEAGKAKHIAPH